MNKNKNVLSLGHVTLKNFRAYAGKTDLNLSLEKEKTIHIIHGEMGLGKTTLLNAIYWCLYGSDRSKKGEGSEEGLINTNVWNNLNINDTDETYVEIFLQENGESRYKIKRTIEFTKTGEFATSALDQDVNGYVPEGMSIESSVEFHYLKPMGNSENWEILRDAKEVQSQIEKIFPEALSSYFLFDAELLNEFIYSDGGQHVKDGIEKISGIPILDDAVKHLKDITRKMKKEIANEQIDTRPIGAEMEKIEQELEKCNAGIEKIKAELPEIRDKKQSISEYLRQHDDREIKSIQDQISSHDEVLRNIEIRNNENEDKLKQFLLDSTTEFLLHDAISSSGEKFQEWENQGRIPIAITKIALNNILDSNPSICICGTVIEEGTAEKQKLEELRNHVVDSSLIQNINAGRLFLSELVTRTNVEDLSEKLRTLKANRGKFNQSYDERKTARNELSKKLENHDIEIVQEKAKDRRALEDKEYKRITELHGLEARKKLGDEHLSTLDEKFKKMSTLSDKYRFNLAKISIANRLSQILEDMKNELIDELRNHTAEVTTNYFHNLVSKKDDFARVEIKPDYKTIALDHNGKTKTLSAGQGCCLALSYIAAIRDIAKRNYFMMIDSPLHNISQQERVDIAKNLPLFLPNTQIILLVQDQEYTGSAKVKITGQPIPSVRDILQKNNNIGKEYILDGEKKDDGATNTIIKLVHTESS